MSVVHRKQLRWAAALKAADQAIAIQSEDGEAYYERACALPASTNQRSDGCPDQGHRTLPGADRVDG